MAVDMSSVADLGQEPLEETADHGVGEEGPDEALLAELGTEFARTQKPAETPKEGVNDAVDELAGEPEPEAEKDEEVEETKSKEDEPKGRAQKRIQALAKEKKELEGRLAQRDREFQAQMQAVHQQQQMQAQALARQNEILQRQLELVAKGQQPIEDESKLTPMEQYERKLLRQAEERAEARLSPKIAAMEQRLAQQDAEKKQDIQRARQQANLRQFTEKANQASKEVLMNDVDMGNFAPEDGNVASDLLLAYVAATGEDTQVAAQKFKMWLDKYHQGRLQRVSKTSGARIQQSQRVSSPMTQSKGSVQTETKPSWDALKSHGYDNYVQWMRAGAPTLSAKR